MTPGRVSQASRGGSRGCCSGRPTLWETTEPGTVARSQTPAVTLWPFDLGRAIPLHEASLRSPVTTGDSVRSNDRAPGIGRADPLRPIQQPWLGGRQRVPPQPRLRAHGLVRGDRQTEFQCVPKRRVTRREGALRREGRMQSREAGAWAGTVTSAAERPNALAAHRGPAHLTSGARQKRTNRACVRVCARK